ncbi:serum response factor-binding protein 1 [Seriola lalandi dorsalis]|uniref:Serum response factor-binding protein 1 n=1 Tax=Seriola lalandi dorsalis TaxID=1841481 RepID=A0A3B4WT61_SERLL|nr:serum response factor-binding protein 1 [Seriola lalandi dorsalis]
MMIHNKDKMEKLLSSAEEKGRVEEEIAEEELEEEEAEEGDKDDDEEEREEDDEEKQSRDDKEKEEEATDKTEKNIPLPAQPKEQVGVLNLNNEVVKMRKEVKRVRALIIRKLTRQIGALKKKKGKEMEIERSQRRAARLLEEIHALKVLSPDLVTKTALQKNLNFEQVCKNPKSTISDRAIARIATHPQFNKKIENIRAAVEAFKEERMKGGKQGGKETMQNKTGKVNRQSPDKREERKSEKEEEDIAVQLKEMSDDEEGDCILKDAKDATLAKPEKDTSKAVHSDVADVQKKEIPASKSVTTAPTKSSEVKNIVKNEPQSKDAGKKLTPAVLQKEQDEEESDLEPSDEEEKEYFDDSTEERFHKQSSQSEESDDDFFVGKVSKFKKKKPNSIEGERKVDKGPEVKGESADKLKATDKVQRELDELESRLKSKATSLQSVFCTSLSGSKQSRGGGAGRGRGGDKFRDQKKPMGGSGLNRDFSKQSKFQKHVTGTERNSGPKYSKPCPEGRGRGRGRGGGDVMRQKVHTGGGAFSQQATQQALHPSWEASKKRKEQQGQILAFQGKKIKFDDDD